MTDQTTLFEDWIDEYGIDRLAQHLGVNSSTVRNWRSLRCDPTVDAMRRIKKLTKGKISYDAMIDRPTPGFTLLQRNG